MSASAAPDRLAAATADLIVGGSLEMSPDRREDAVAIAAMLPAGTRVFVNHLPRHGLPQTLQALLALREAGLDPVPHIAARRVQSRIELATFMQQAVTEAGVSKVLLIGGDDPQPVGPYPDAVALLREGILADRGLREIGMAGYPEGHARIARGLLEHALTAKLEIVAKQKLGAFIVTQFSFAPARVVEYCAELARSVPDVPVYVGMAGPTDMVTLLRFAQRCGVSASLRALTDQGLGAVKLFTHTDPAEQLAAVAHYCVRHPTCNVFGAHLFSFGAAARSAQWMNARITTRAG